MLLATIGLYGVVSFSAIQRTREVSIRIAIGAQYMDLLKLVMGRGMKLTLIGITLGLLAEVTPTRLMVWISIVITIPPWSLPG